MPDISYETFASLDLRVARIIAVSIVENADRLYELTLDVGHLDEGGLGERTVVSGIRPWFEPDDLLGKTIIYLANLEPRVLRGVKSQGMILAAGEEKPVLLTPAQECAVGAQVR